MRPRVDGALTDLQEGSMGAPCVQHNPPCPLATAALLRPRGMGDRPLTLHVLRDVPLNLLAGAAEGAWGPRGPGWSRWARHVHGA